MTILLMLLGINNVLAQPKELVASLSTYFQNYPIGFTTPPTRITLTDVQVSDSTRVLHIYVNETFGMQHFTPAKVRQVYQDVKTLLPETYRDWRLIIYAQEIPIEELVIGGTETAANRVWNNRRNEVPAWVTMTSRPFDIDKGLDGIHLCLWASHGRYYALEEQKWRWQRPYLFCTTEDLFSQTIVVPYLMPMLENAGAVLVSPRERDWQRNEIIVDNDTPNQDGIYAESIGKHQWEPCDTGFAHLKTVYFDGENPFRHGTSRMALAHNHGNGESTICWTPNVQQAGNYAVYVSYTTCENSVSDAQYTVRHQGIDTHFKVNQQMGGGTWVYLGTFTFDAGASSANCVILTNHSGDKGVVTADAVRFGGGMGNIARGTDSLNIKVSGMPRFLEGARYATQWYGMPYKVYGTKLSQNDYGEDINARSLMCNYLAGGSDYFPSDTGLHVPIELSLAIHTDAGYTQDESYIGSLGIYTTFPNERMLTSGLSRLASRDLCEYVLSQVESDLTATYGRWNRRQMFDRNYSETREPAVPSIILEMVSHQNFADMVKAHDPHFKFTMARAIYKGVLRFVASAHRNNNVCVQPLPVSQLAADIDTDTRDIHLTWAPVTDPLEPSAQPSAYVVYHSEAGGGFDNGTVVRNSQITFHNVRTDVLHSFRVKAINDGGASMSSATVCASISAVPAPKVLIIDGFNRLAGPYPVENDSLQGFDLHTDIGVPMAQMPGYCGRQLYFGRDGMGREDSRGLGYSEAHLEGIILAGNTADWSVHHALDMLACKPLNIASCTADALDRDAFDPATFQLLDVICGLNKVDGYSLVQVRAFTPAVRQAMATMTRLGGAVLTSGAFIGSDMADDEGRVFTRSVLHYEYAGALPPDSIDNLTSWDSSFTIHQQPNEESYMVPAADMLAPLAPAFCAIVYAPGGQSAAVAYDGKDHRAMSLGFPLESIENADERRHLLLGILNFLIR